MDITNKRKKELRAMSFGNLQSTEEYNHYLDNYIFNKSKLMNEEVEYILKKSHEDNDAPFSYEDFPSYYYEKDELIDDFLETFDTLNNDYEDIKYFLDNINEDLFQNQKQPTQLREDLKFYLNNMDLDDIINLCKELDINMDEFEHQTEVMQWFLMDERILYQLKERGEVILNDKYWGRQCFGQSISMDSVIIDIFKEWYLNF